MGILTLALILRLVMPVAVQTPDSALYLELADRMKMGHLDIERFGEAVKFLQPGYSAVIALGSFIIGDVRNTGIFISILCGVASVLVCYQLGKKMFGHQIGALFSIMIAISPLFISYSAKILTESIFTLLFLVIVYLTWEYYRAERSWWYLLFGVSIGALYLIRMVGLLCLAVPIGLSVIDFYRRSMSWRRLCATLTLLFVGFAIVAGPYIYFISRQYGHLVFTGMQDYYESVSTVMTDMKYDMFDSDVQETVQANKKAALYRLNNNRTDYEFYGHSTGDANYSSSSITTVIGKRLQNFISNIPYNIKFFTFIFATETLAILIIISAMVRGRVPWKQYVFLLAWIAVVMLVPLSGRSVYRYYFPVVPLLWLVTITSVMYVFRRINIRLVRNYFIGMALVFVILYGFIINVLVIHDYILNFGKVFYRYGPEAVGTEFRKAFGDGQKILSTNRVFVYYAGGLSYPVPYAPISDVVVFARNNGIGYLAINHKINDYAGVGLDSLTALYPEHLLELWQAKEGIIVYKIIGTR